MKKSLPLFLIMLFVLSTPAREICSNYSPIASPDGNYLYFSSNRVDDTYFIYLDMPLIVFDALLFLTATIPLIGRYK